MGGVINVDQYFFHGVDIIRFEIRLEPGQLIVSHLLSGCNGTEWSAPAPRDAQIRGIGRADNRIGQPTFARTENAFRLLPHFGADDGTDRFVGWSAAPPRRRGPKQTEE